MPYYDLYGESYASERDAMNAESAQMAQIDADLAMQQARSADDHISRLYNLCESQAHEIAELRIRIEALEPKESN